MLGSDIEDMVSMMGFGPYDYQHFVDNIYRFLNSKIKDDYLAKGYFATYEVTLPLKKKKELIPDYRALRGYKYTLRKGQEYGTTVELTWKDSMFNQLTVKFIENPKKKVYWEAIMSVILCSILYVLTFVFPEYWIWTIVTLFICFLLTFVMLILPGIIGVVLGMALGDMLYGATADKAVKEVNRRDREQIRKEVLFYANQLADKYRAQRITPPISYYQPPPVMPPPQPPRTTEFCPNCGCEIPIGQKCPICNP